MNDTGTTQLVQNDGHTPYSRYVQTEVLHTLQDFVSDSPAEPAFLANVQISEIYWALITRELVTAQAELRHGRQKTLWFHTFHDSAGLYAPLHSLVL